MIYGSSLTPPANALMRRGAAQEPRVPHGVALAETGPPSSPKLGRWRMPEPPTSQHPSQDPPGDGHALGRGASPEGAPGRVPATTQTHSPVSAAGLLDC